MKTITQAIKENWKHLSDRSKKHALDSGRVPDDQWVLTEDGYDYATITAYDADEALREARDNVDRANYCDAEGRTLYIDIAVRNPYTGEEAYDTVTLDPEEPECDDGEDHDWQSPEWLGGCRENPGVWGHGGGVIITEVCSHCGRYRHTDTWAQRRDTGEQGLTEVRYEDADERSEEWVEELREEEESEDE